MENGSSQSIENYRCGTRVMVTLPLKRGRNREGAARRLMTESHLALPELNNLELIANLA
jgi:hypothetical protein